MNVPAAVAVARAQVRRRWPELIGLGVAAGLVAGTVAGLVGGARRTESALDRLVVATGENFDVLVTAFQPDRIDDVLGLPDITRSRVDLALVGHVSSLARPEQQNRYLSVEASDRPLDGEQVLLRGRYPDPAAADEVVVLEGFAEEFGEDVGTRFHWRSLTRKEFLAFAEGRPTATGPIEADLEVVGVVRNARGIAEIRASGVIGGAGFRSLLQEDEVAWASIWLAARPGRLGALLEDLGALVDSTPSPATGFSGLAANRIAPPHAAVRDALRTQGRGLLLVALVLALAGGAAVAQALDRRISAGDADDRLLSALGFVRSGRVLGRGLPAALSAGVALVVAAGVALASSAFTPVGSARRAEPDPGLLVDWAVVGGAAAGVVAFVLVAAFGSAWVRVLRGNRPSVATRSALADRVAAAGAPAPVAVGVRLAVESGQGPTRVPTRSTLAGVAAAVAGVAAAATVATNLDRLLETPARYGWPGEMQLRNLTAEQFDALVADSRIASVTRQNSAGARVGGVDVVAVSYEYLRGDLRPTLLAGRHPRRGEVALGPELARDLDVGIGDLVAVGSGPDAQGQRFQVVGIAITSSSDSATRAAVFTPEDLTVVQSREPFVEAMVRTGADRAAREALAADLGAEVELVGPEPPQPVINLRELRAIPPAMTVALVLLGAAAVAHGVGSSVRRRQRDLAVLRTLGFVRRRISATVLAAAATTAVIGLLLGLPVGLALGTAAWSRIAASVFVPDDVRFPAVPLALLVPLTVLLALAAAAVPARRAARLRPSEILRGE